MQFLKYLFAFLSLSLAASLVTLPPLPYAYSALEPYISSETLHFHHDKHHAEYVTKTNALITGTNLENADLVTIVQTAHREKNTLLFNNAAQVWNHNFYFSCMAPSGGGPPTGLAAELITSSFGSYEAFKQQFLSASTSQFGSGYAWLVYVPAEGTAKVINTANANNPIIMQDTVALLTTDVWEHAYYLDHPAQRAQYVSDFLAHLVNWDFVNQQIPIKQ